MKTNNIVQIRILPVLSIARLGSSPDPMDNYEFDMRDLVGYRKLVPAATFRVDKKTGKIISRYTPKEVMFRDQNKRIRPVAPFVEVWAQFNKYGPLIPLTLDHLEELGISTDSISWRVKLGNNKAFRRTSDGKDKILADSGNFSDFKPHQLSGSCPNFFKDKFIPFGYAQFIKPTKSFPEIRLRFTPAGGFVYGPKVNQKKNKHNGRPIVKDEVYRGGRWIGHTDGRLGVRATNPGAIFYDQGTSRGFLDDECDGTIEVTLSINGKILTAFSRVVAGPPTFAPDGLPVRTVNDDLEQALLGPDVDGDVTPHEMKDIVRRALETVRLMNTAMMNDASDIDNNNNMAAQDVGSGRLLSPIVSPEIADSLAIRARHEYVLRALESGSQTWFSRMLRRFDEVGDLSDLGRRKMPALMRGADGNHLALTRRQYNKVVKADVQVEARRKSAHSRLKKKRK